MARSLGLAVDPTAGGTKYDDVVATPTPVAIPDPTVWIPATTATMSRNPNNLNRNNEVRGVRGSAAPIAFSADPTVSFESRAYPQVAKLVLSAALSGTPAATGTAPAAITTKIEPTQANPLRTLVAHLHREEQYEVESGIAVDSVELKLPADAEGTLTVEGKALYHDVKQTLPSPLPTTSYTGLGEHTFMLRDVKAYKGAGAGVLIDCLAGLTIKFDNGLIDDFTSRFCAGQNVRSYTVNSQSYRQWYPTRHRIGPQLITGRLDFGLTRPDLELERVLAVADKLVIEASAGPISPATTPAVDEVLRITLAKSVLTGGGADPLVDEGDIKSNYEFGGFVDPSTGKDITVEFVSKTAVS